MKDKLLTAAWTARQAAYAPYSGYAVGAALVTRDGTIITGCNVENVSLGLTCCAERVAAFTAVARGHRDWVTMAVVASGEALPYPCGACRQVLSEFAPQLSFVVANDSHSIEISLQHLLPHGFQLPKA